MKIFFIVSGLNRGGAEMMLLNLTADLLLRRHQVYIVGIKGAGELVSRFREAGAIVETPERAAIWASVKFLFRIPSMIGRIRPTCIQGWMYIGCIVASLAGRIWDTPVFWSLHHSNFDPRYNRPLTLMSIKLAACISRVLPPQATAYCGPNSRDLHYEIGFAKKSAIIPNGVDIKKFTPNNAARIKMRERFGISEESVVIGIFANKVLIKDHQMFFEAAKRVKKAFPRAIFICCGKGIDSSLVDEFLLERDVADAVRFLGQREDIPDIMNACDMIVLSSRGESLPMVLTEAAACGIPIISTNVGDCKWIVGNEKLLVSPGDEKGFADAILKLINTDPGTRVNWGLSNRRRIMKLFDRELVVDRYIKFISAESAVAEIC